MCRGQAGAHVADKRYPSREHAGPRRDRQGFRERDRREGDGRCRLESPVPWWTTRAHRESAWIVDGATMAKQLGLERVRLLNDLEATAYGISRDGAGRSGNDLRGRCRSASAARGDRRGHRVGRSHALLGRHEARAHGNRGRPRRFRAAHRSAGRTCGNSSSPAASLRATS